MSVVAAFLEGVTAFPDTVAFRSDEGAYTYRELDLHTIDIAAALQARNPTSIPKVAIYSGNNISAFACVLSVLRCGGVWVPVNWRNSVEANIAWLTLTESNWLFFHSEFEAEAVQIAA
ncbi:MAG: AMP-binding protein [Azoarcus sp.]